MKDKHGVSHPLCCLDTNAAKKTLGVFIVMDENQQLQINCLMEVSTTFGHCMRATSCPKFHTLHTFSASHMKSVKHFLPVNCFSSCLGRHCQTRCCTIPPKGRNFQDCDVHPFVCTPPPQGLQLKASLPPARPCPCLHLCPRICCRQPNRFPPPTILQGLGCGNRRPC